MLSITFSDHLPSETGAFVLGVPKNQHVVASDFLEEPVKKFVETLTEAKAFTGQSGEVVSGYGYGSTNHLICLGLGSLPMSETEALVMGGKLAIHLEKQKIERAVVLCSSCEEDALCAMAEGLLLRSWRFYHYKKSNQVPLQEVVFLTKTPDVLQQRFQVRAQVAESVLWARGLVNEPGNMLTPQAFVEEIKTLQDLGLSIDILDKEHLCDLGMGALLGVAQGSDQDPFVGIIKWQGGQAEEKPVAFVGKGVTFDSGGLSLKPSRGMEDMKGDMGGAAVVVGLLRALALTKASVNAVGVVALVENMPSGKAQRPGDIVKSLSGKTIEVLNTDAEGRLILADALYYAHTTFAPRIIIDVATLTGAMRYALGPEYAGLFSPINNLAETLEAAGKKVHEKVWRLPLCDAFTKAMESSVADLQNISSAGYGAGSSTAAAFLQCFTGDTPWAHLDIANVDFNAKDTVLATQGGGAFGVRLLYYWLTQLSHNVLSKVVA